MFLNQFTLILFVYFIIVNLFGVFVGYLVFTDGIIGFYKHFMGVKPSYDYIIVGGGSSGSLLAARLAQDSNLKVVLLEAGSSGSSLFDAPSLGLMLQGTSFDWKYKTVPQKHACLGLEDQISFWPMGKILGGSSMLNNMVYMRADPKDYARWYKNQNFDYERDILPYFRKLEDSLSISDPAFQSILADHIKESAGAMGHSVNDGLHATLGFSQPKATIFSGSRWTTSHYLRSLSQPNLEIYSNTHVEKVLLKNNYEAYAVKYSHFGITHYIRASKAIILSAGTIGSPKILLQSGIGPTNHLKEVGIPPKINLPVGANLQDHVSTGFDLVILNTSLKLGIPEMLSPYSLYEYVLNGGGPWTTMGCEGLGLFKVGNPGEVPNLQLMMLPLGVTTDQGIHLRKLVGIGNKLYQDYFAKIPQNSVSFLPIVLHPKSRGTLRLKDKNPKSPPLINPNYLSDGRDIDVMIQGIEIIRKLISTKAMKKLGAKLNTVPFPSCKHLVFGSYRYWECYVRHLTLTVYHPVGTCALGSVIDYNFQVKGTNKLFVVDGSVLPDLPTGNPNGAIMMMAEKAADILKNHQFLTTHSCEIMEIFVGRYFC